MTGDTKIRVFVNGALGRMGTETVKAIKACPDLHLTGGCDTRARNQKISSVTRNPSDKGEIFTDLDEALDRLNPKVVVDFTNPQAVYPGTLTVLRRGIHCVVGTTGLSEREMADLANEAEKRGIGLAIIPNFAVGAVLMMKFAQEAAEFFKDVEIIELHHDGKLDAPSGTAIKTAEMIAAGYPEPRKLNRREFEKIAGARGGDLNGIRIHSVRLPGMVAHQEVIFGGQGQALTIRHDAFNRECFMPGVILAIRKIRDVKGMVYGLEKMI